jgi:hypothetical protein
MNKHLESLAQKPMTRKEFLTTLGLGAASVFGFSSVIKLMSGKSNQQSNASAGYGSSVYGGGKKSAV